MKRLACLLFLFLLTACAAAPLPKALHTKGPPRLGIIGFKMTAPVKDLSSIMENPPEDLIDSVKAALLSERIHEIEDKASGFLLDELRQENTVEPVLIPDGVFGTHRGEGPTESQMSLLRKEFSVDAVLYGEIPQYGKTRLIYPILGETLDITAESVIIGLATSWNYSLILGNIGFELLTSTPVWFGGAYFFGLAFRPVTVEAWAVSEDENKVIWHKKTDKISSRKFLKAYPESEQSKKEIQLEASLRNAVNTLARELSR